MRRVPTEKQFHKLMAFGSGAMLVSGLSRDTRSFLKHGWLAPENPEVDAENGLRITPDGLHALAAAAHRYGVPRFQTRIRPYGTGG